MHLIQNNKELERKCQYQVGVLFTGQNTEETYTFPWKIFLESKYSKFFPLNSQISWILFDGTCITNMLSTNQNECKGSEKNKSYVPWESEPRVQTCGKSNPKSLSQAQVHSHRRVHTSRPHPQHCCRFPADLPSTCHVLSKTQSWSFLSGGFYWKEHRVLVPRHLVEILRIVNPGGEF